ncbi:sensor histidine kinase [Arthrobacter halodurans]|uniref:histidine kinase n=1 Tax=Arthrobacter halodurans TaxID=516699 RepID=A0ABV4UM89_9MICC
MPEHTAITNPPPPAGTRRRVGAFTHWPLRSKLVAITLALLAVICLAIGVSVHRAMDQFLSTKLDEQLERAAGGALRSQRQFRVYEDTALVERGHGPPTLNARIRPEGMDRAGVFTPDGRVEDLTPADEEILEGLVAEGTAADRELSVGNYRLVAQSRERDGEVIVTGLPLADAEATLSSLTGTMSIASASGLAAAAVIGTVVIRRTLRPLEELSGIATRVAGLSLNEGEVATVERVPDGIAGARTEVGRLGHAFNRMLDNIDGAFSARHSSELRLRRFIADASHELRTPLTSIRGYADMIRLAEDLGPDGRASLSRVDAEARRMTSLVDDLLFLARLDENNPAAREDVDLTELVVESVDDVRVAAPNHRWILEVPDHPLTVRADPGQLRQVLINLLSNAHRHTGPGTTVTTSVRAAPDGDTLLSVADDGPGIPEDFIELVFSRFALADASRSDRSGTHGLGLAIAKGIVESHGGRISVRSTADGTTFTVRLPGRGDGPAADPDAAPGGSQEKHRSDIGTV